MAIIGISGKIGSGKDTVGSIIQYITSEYKNHGQINQSYDDFIKFEDWRGSAWKVKKFAGKLKEITSILTGCTVEQLESQEFKNQQLSSEWDYVLNGSNKPVNDKTFEHDEVFKANPKRFIKHLTYREVLQKVGTEAMRDCIHENIWVNALFADYRPSIPHKVMNIASDVTLNFDAKWPNWCITDCRFPNELEAIRERKGISIRVNRNYIDNENKIQKVNIEEHPSETALDNSIFDYTIDNSGTIEELVEKVREILIKEKII